MSFRNESASLYKNNDEDTTVEGILESIRGVMAQDDDYDFLDDDDILDLTDIVEDESVKLANVNNSIKSKSVLDVIDDVLKESHVAEKKALNDNKSSKPVVVSDSLIEDKVITESSNILKNLIENTPQSKINYSSTPAGITLEQLTIEAIKPLLADWLNKNLPALVKQVVTEEVKKIVPRNGN
jgi:cell pole-organizing protein PopZ